jgi:hypothetical protein
MRTECIVTREESFLQTHYTDKFVSNPGQGKWKHGAITFSLEPPLKACQLCHSRSAATGRSLLIFIDKGNDDDLGVENQFDEVCDPLEVGIRAGVPNIEPKSEVKSTPISRPGFTAAVDRPV